MYLQTAAGTFTRTDRPTFDPDSTYEDTAVLFFDADGDKDPDLLVSHSWRPALAPTGAIR